jgi:hypothetical protein
MAVNLQNPIDIFGNFRCNIGKGNRKLGKLVLTFGRNLSLTLGKQNFRLKDKAIANNLNIVAPFQYVTQPAKKF